MPCRARGVRHRFVNKSIKHYETIRFSPRFKKKKIVSTLISKKNPASKQPTCCVRATEGSTTTTCSRQNATLPLSSSLPLAASPLAFFSRPPSIGLSTMPLRSTSGSEPVPPRPICLPLVLLFSSFLPEKTISAANSPSRVPFDVQCCHRRRVNEPAQKQ